MLHIILLGDSILDNGAYTNGGPDVISQVRLLLPPGNRATLLALDGATTEHVPSQVGKVPPDATHLVLSVGGNDALMNSSILYSPATSASQVLLALAEASQHFEERYRKLVQSCIRLELPLAICTIYNGCFADPEFQRLVSTALMVFNDVIVRVGTEFNLTIIDLRFVCSSPADYANPIEPSSQGGAKIARAVVNWGTGGQAERAARIAIP